MTLISEIFRTYGPEYIERYGDFTVPEQIRDFIRSHQRICYNAMFKASSEAMKALAADERYIGGDLPGFQGVLHTWGRQMPYNPHVHYVVPGGAISKSDGKWHSSRAPMPGVRQ